METNLRACKKCNVLKQRIEVGKFDARNKKFIDEHGKLWSGSYCPPCNQERVKLAMRIKRNVKEA
jgi:hypothetical protein